MKQEQTYITRSHDVVLNKEYNDWLNELGQRYERACLRAALKVNSEKLLWNWQMGRDLVMRKAEEKWGSGVVEQLSLDLQNRYPGEKGFGAANLWFMKKWYLFYSEKLCQAGRESLSTDNMSDTKLYQLGREIHEADVEEGISFPELFAYVPWRHHVEIIHKCSTLKEASFYLYRIIEEGWSREVLVRSIKDKMYEKQGAAITNYGQHLSVHQAELAQEITKENYDFGFLSLPRKYKEEQLEDALCEQMTRFLLELGSGFAFVGRQKELVVDGTPRRIDLLFYHIRLRCYVVIELKATSFQPEFAGKLNFYVTAVNHLIKTSSDNPTIGLLICSNMKETEVKWSFETINAPIGVATYSNVQVEELKKHLPTIEQLQERINLLEMELFECKLKKSKH